MDVNLELTTSLKSNPKFKSYLSWLSSNGCLFPSVIPNQLDYPVAFWKEGIIGAQAKRDIGPNKAYIFVPYTICINLHKAKTSEISHIFKKKFFTKHSRATDHILWVFVLYEKLKGPSSFWFPYFSCIEGYQNLVDWSESELNELQDPLIVYDNLKWRERIERIWLKIKKIIESYPEFFPPEHDLHSEFMWTWKICCTRGYAWDGGMLIPMADNINHGEVYTSYESETQAMLQILAKNKTGEVDYSDFLDLHTNGEFKADPRHNMNKLEKFLSSGLELKPCEKIWDLDKELEGLRSSSSEDDERNIAECTSDEESAFEQEDSEEPEQSKADEDNFFMMSTGVRTFFRKGEQVFNAYGRLNNRNLLLDYGFATEGNRYDTVYFLLWLPRSGREGLVKIQDIKAKTQEYVEFTELYGLKKKRLNIDVFVYFRENMTVTVKNFPSRIEVELEIIDKFLNVCFEMHDEFKTSLEEDEELLLRSPGHRLKSALFYRMNQKKIILNQIKMLEVLRKELESVQNGLSLDQHLIGRSLKEIQDLYPLKSYLQSFIRYSKSPTIESNELTDNLF